MQQPTQVQLTDGRTINHYYDGGGKLLKTVYSNGETWEFGNGIIYKNGQPYQMSTPEGRAIYQNGTWQNEFDYKDHLGNTRVSFKANGTQLEKVAETAFDPWGVVLNGLGQQNAFQNRFEMQGKESEKTFGLNRINFGARTVNPTTGIFDRADPLADIAPSFSPFAYVNNNPVLMIDPDGMKTVWNGQYGDKSAYNDDETGESRSWEQVQSELGMGGGGESIESDEGKKSNTNNTSISSVKEKPINKKLNDPKKVEPISFIRHPWDIDPANLSDNPFLRKIQIALHQFGFFPGFGSITGAASKGVSTLVKIGTIEDDVMIFSAKIGDEMVEGITNFAVQDGKLLLNKLHLQGSEAGNIGRGALWEMAKDLGRQYNVKEVIIQGGRRTTGKFKGELPSPITIKVD